MVRCGAMGEGEKHRETEEHMERLRERELFDQTEKRMEKEGPRDEQREKIGNEKV